MADNPFGQVGGFLSGLLNPVSEETKTQNVINTPIATSTGARETSTYSSLSATARTASAIDSTPSTSVLTSSTTAISSTPSTTSIPSTITEQHTTFDPAATSIAISTSSTLPSSTAATTAGPAQTSPVNAGAVAGGVVGGLAVLALLVFGILWLMRRPRKTPDEKKDHSSKPYENSVISLVAFGKDTNDSRPVTSSRPWNTSSSSSNKTFSSSAHLVGPSIYVTDEYDQRRKICELPGSAPVQPSSELESGQKYHAYRPRGFR
ncbi:uncharacterized protein SEPMUDRAFT_132905 [Sphaerulina musiva SO2202]|uniref:Mid2 domain-containing protein n=1 Tax=Sphaerulina musiva (strain SO2202) TaxID=692275 RepID=M3D648_SPHMS|nr:uncharacterized protein SEPMUDRAFT_132905 [Sphaerulina musiva SO2202]EMF13650.1 hypothetical protein SEPMUDRAFT_132905 [Sphaerulina musiva SO2202]